MTRGRLVIVIPGGAYRTSEYNGDMYMNQGESCPDVPISPGDIARQKIDEVNDLESFEKMVREFTEYYYGPEYANIELSEEEFENECALREVNAPAFLAEGNVIDFGNYFQFWFSDFIYLKNASEENLKIMTRDGKVVILEPGDSNVFYFGRVWVKDEENE